MPYNTTHQAANEVNFHCWNPWLQRCPWLNRKTGRNLFQLGVIFMIFKKLTWHYICRSEVINNNVTKLSLMAGIDAFGLPVPLQC